MPFLENKALPFEDRFDIKDYLREQEGVGDAVRAVDDTRNAIDQQTNGALTNLTNSLGLN